MKQSEKSFKVTPAEEHKEHSKVIDKKDSEPAEIESTPAEIDNIAEDKSEKANNKVEPEANIEE